MNMFFLFGIYSYYVFDIFYHLLYFFVVYVFKLLRVSDFFFFFKQKTAYEMRISDWSSDVCSSDLDPRITFTRASTKAYFDADGVLQFAASGVFPLDHRPITGRRRGRLPEGAATNLRTRSCEFTNAAYSEDGATSLDKLATAPVGTLTAGLLLEDGSNGAHTQTDDVTITADTVYAVSCWFRAGRRPPVALRWGDTGGDRKSPRLNSSH